MSKAGTFVNRASDKIAMQRAYEHVNSVLNDMNAIPNYEPLSLESIREVVQWLDMSLYPKGYDYVMNFKHLKKDLEDMENATDVYGGIPDESTAGKWEETDEYTLIRRGNYKQFEVMLRNKPYDGPDILIGLQRTKASYCRICKRVHDRTNQYILIEKGKAWLKCPRVPWGGPHAWLIGLVKVDSIVQRETELGYIKINVVNSSAGRR